MFPTFKMLFFVMFSSTLVACASHNQKNETVSKTPTLTGTWQVEDIDQGGVIDNAMVTIEFLEDGRISGSTGCNRFSGSLKTEEELQTFEIEIIDRFGQIPSQVEDLLNSVRIKWLSKELGIEKIILKQKRMIGYFVSDQQSEFYQTTAFTKMLKYVQKNSKSCVMKEKETKNGLRLLVTFIKIDSVKRALEVLNKI